jgi:hypothetical protein
VNGEPRRWVDRRAVFLLCSAVVSLLLVPVAPPDFEYVGVVVAVWCTILAIGSWLDKWSRDNS